MIVGSPARLPLVTFVYNSQKKDTDKQEEVYPMPPPIPDTPENLARLIMQGPPKKDWRYLKLRGKKRDKK
jgi:hypothetical protein